MFDVLVERIENEELINVFLEIINTYPINKAQNFRNSINIVYS
jgi:hypothetical protein